MFVNLGCNHLLINLGPICVYIYKHTHNAHINKKCDFEENVQA